MNDISQPPSIDLAWLVTEAIHNPGVAHEAHTRLAAFTLPNQLAAWVQCRERGLPPGYLATLEIWNSHGRRVRRGEKALLLLDAVRRDDAEPSGLHVRWRPFGFVEAQTRGAAFTPPPTTWDEEQLLFAHELHRIPIEPTARGLVRGRGVALDPHAPDRLETFLTLVAACLLTPDRDVTLPLGRHPASAEEAEATAVALLCLDALGSQLAGTLRPRVTAWWARETPTIRLAWRLLKAAAWILRDGSGPAVADAA